MELSEPCYRASGSHATRCERVFKLRPVYMGHGQNSLCKAQQLFDKGPIESLYNALLRSFDHGCTWLTFVASVASTECDARPS